jgi:hypothetical protein
MGPAAILLLASAGLGAAWVSAGLVDSAPLLRLGGHNPPVTWLFAFLTARTDQPFV